MVPVVVAVTLTEIAQEADAARVPPDRLMLPDAATAVTVPPQVFVTEGVAATTTPAGRVSVKATPERAVEALGLPMEKLRVEFPLTVTLEGLNDLLKDGAVGAVTVRSAKAGPPSPPSVEVKLPLTLFLTPMVVAVTFTEIEQLAEAARVPPDRLMLPDPATAVTVPLHVFVVPGEAATTRPAGSESVKATPEADAAPFGLAIEKVRTDVPLRTMLVGLNALVKVGGRKAVAVKVADAVPPLPP